jgi:hypothetical protein
LFSFIFASLCCWATVALLLSTSPTYICMWMYMPMYNYLT